MLQKIKTYLFERQARKFLSTEDRNRRFVNYNKARTVLVLFESDAEEKNSNVQDIIRLLQADGKKVTAWGFVNKKDCTTSIMRDFRILHQKQADVFGKPDVAIITELQDMEFDLLIDLSLKPVLYIQYLVMYAKVLFKTGLRKTDMQIYDFILDAVSTTNVSDEISEHTVDEMYLFNQIFFYLKSIQTND